MSPRTLTMWLLGALIDAGTWMSRAELAAVRDCSDVALEDALADLVVAGKAHFREHVGYRLAATPACRAAARKRVRERARVAVVGMPANDGYRLGVAEDRAGLGVVMYELALPLAGPDEDAHELLQRRVNAVLDFVNERGGATCVTR